MIILKRGSAFLRISRRIYNASAVSVHWGYYLSEAGSCTQMSDERDFHFTRVKWSAEELKKDKLCLAKYVKIT